MNKPLRIFWSDAALDGAGLLIASLQRTLIAECGEIAQDSRRWFIHVLEHETTPESYLVSGEEYADEWRMFVQIAHYDGIAPDAIPPSNIPAVQMPVADEIEGNDHFSEIAMIQ